MHEPDHYIVHSLYKNSKGESKWHVTMPHNELGAAVRECRIFQDKGRQSFVTARDGESSILYIMAVADYPVHGVTNLSAPLFGGLHDDRTFDAVNTFASKMDWTI